MDFLADVRTQVRQAVEDSYGFQVHPGPKSMRDNAALARQLLINSAFIYRVRPNILQLSDFLIRMCSQEHNYYENLPNQYPYRHPIIQEAINILWFKNRDDDGMAFQEHFSPMPIRAMALVLTAVGFDRTRWSLGC